jgi:lysozyme
MSLRTTRLGLSLVKEFEGLRLSAYKCPAGVWTIGYGHTTAAGGPAVKPGMKITKAQAEKILADDIDRFEDQVERILGAKGQKLTAHQFDALVSLAFNIGLGAFGKSTLVRKIKSGDLAAVPSQIMRWNKVKGKELSGLTRRRRAECALWRNDDEDAERYTDAKFGPMPQAVDEPEPPKSMIESKTGGAAVVAGAGTAAATAEKITEQVEHAESWVEMAQRIMSMPAVWIGVVVVGCAVFIWFDRRRRLREDHV